MSRRCGAIALWILCATAVADGDVVAGKALYAVCAGCHGFVGEGQRAVNAPKLVGLEDWYLRRQLDYFRRGIRGTAPEDAHGRQMAPMALVLADERAVEDVVAYIGTLPDMLAEPTLDGDLERGRGRYAVCGACHGQNAEGMEALSAPALAGLDDWYLVNQLKLYRDGHRGAHPDDTYGQQMRAIVPVLADEQAMLDLAAYLSTLN